MRKRLLSFALPAAVIMAGSIGIVAIPSAHADDANAVLKETIDEILDDERLDGAQASVIVSDPETDETIYESQGNARHMPASNTKLITGAAALDLLGGDYTYQTDVHAAGDIRGPVVTGDLYLRGTGDPTMLEEDYAGLAAELADSGVHTITGDLVADDTVWDDDRLGRSWPWDNEQFYYQPQISPLTLSPDTDYDPGTVFVSVTPGEKPGDEPEVTLTPDTDYVTVDNTASTVEEGEESAVNITRAHATNTFEISGDIPVGADDATSWTTVWEPTGYATAVFADALEDEGIRVVGDVRLGESVPDDATELATHESMTIDELMIPFMKLSNNGHSEALVKTVGDELADSGTWDAGLEEMSEFLEESGVDTSVMRQADGSGLSRMNDISSEAFIDLLNESMDQPWFDEFYDSLPIACEEDRFVGGTLGSRMCDTPAEGNVHAKTGSLTGVSGLSGYVTDADGRDLSFSILLNNWIAAEGVKDIEDQIAIALASFSAEEASAPMPQYSPAETTGDPELECSWTKPATC